MKKDVWTDIVVSSALLNFFFSAPDSFRMDLISIQTMMITSFYLVLFVDFFFWKDYFEIQENQSRDNIIREFFYSRKN